MICPQERKYTRFLQQSIVRGLRAGRHPRPYREENRRIPFDPEGRLTAMLRRRTKLGPNAFVFGTENGECVGSFKTAWDSLLLIANGHHAKRPKHGARVDRDKLRDVDLHWHDLRHEGACRLLADGVDIRIIQLMLGHASVQQTQRYLNVTDEELRRGLEISWKRRTLKAVAGRTPKLSARGLVCRGV
jgi:integrase